MTVHEPIVGPTGPQPHRFSQAEYRLLSDNGAFDRYAKTELIEGVILTVNAQYSRHARIQSLLLRLLGAACDDLAAGIGAWVELSITMGDLSLPRPDIVVTYGLPDRGPVLLEAVAIVIEVADSSLDTDLKTKAAFYAAAGVLEYWVADTEGRCIHQLWSPLDGSYADNRIVAFGAPVTAATIPDLTIDTTRL